MIGNTALSNFCYQSLFDKYTLNFLQFYSIQNLERKRPKTTTTIWLWSRPYRFAYQPIHPTRYYYQVNRAQINHERWKSSDSRLNRVEIQNQFNCKISKQRNISGIHQQSRPQKHHCQSSKKATYENKIERNNTVEQSET